MYSKRQTNQAMPSIQAIMTQLEQVAPLVYQEAYDNAGLQIGNPGAAVQSILLALDVTQAVLEEAVTKGCNLIITHHPLFFKPIKHLRSGSLTTQYVSYAMRNHLNIYAIHTNLDNVIPGVSHHMGQQLQLRNMRVLIPRADTQYQLTIDIPTQALPRIQKKLYSMQVADMATYPLSQYVPSTTAHAPNSIPMTRLEAWCPLHLAQAAPSILQKAYPQVAMRCHTQLLCEKNPAIGTGIWGELPEPMDANPFLQHLKKTFNLTLLRHSACPATPIKTVALCGGSGAFTYAAAHQQKVDALVTADLKHHDFNDATDQLLLVDIGHYESELGCLDLLYTELSQKFTKIPIFKSQRASSPICYT